MDEFDLDIPSPILVHFQDGNSELTSLEKLEERSLKSITKATETIQSMASTITQAIRNIKLSERPSQVEVEFGIELTAEAGALIAQASTTASILVKLKWEKTNAASNQPSVSDDSAKR